MRCSGFIIISCVASSGRIHWIVVKGCVANEHGMKTGSSHMGRLNDDIDSQPIAKARCLYLVIYTIRGYFVKYDFAAGADLSRSSSESPMPLPGHFDEPWVSRHIYSVTVAHLSRSSSESEPSPPSSQGSHVEPQHEARPAVIGRNDSPDELTQDVSSMSNLEHLLILA